MANYKKLYNKHKQLIPLVILLGLCVVLLAAAIKGTVEFADVTYPFMLAPANYYAFAAVLINFIIYFSRRSLYKYSLITTLLLGFFGLLDFTALETGTIYTLGSFSIGLEPLCFYLLLVYFILNLGKILRRPDKQVTKDTEQTKDRKTTKEELAIAKYKLLYANQTTEQLEKILAEKKIVETAREALMETLQERRQINDESVNKV